jgi:hypothetical protein
VKLKPQDIHPGVFYFGSFATVQPTAQTKKTSEDVAGEVVKKVMPNVAASALMSQIKGQGLSTPISAVQEIGDDLMKNLF